MDVNFWTESRLTRGQRAFHAPKVLLLDGQRGEKLRQLALDAFAVAVQQVGLREQLDTLRGRELGIQLVGCAGHQCQPDGFQPVSLALDQPFQPVHVGTGGVQLAPVVIGGEKYRL